jgi:hypothetical protein
MATLELEVSPDGCEWYKVSKALTTKNFSFGDTKLQWSEYVKKDPVFEGVNVDDYDYGEIDLLIGNNMEEYFLRLDGEENRRRNKNGVLALKTQLGWTIADPLRAAAAPTKYNCYTTVVNASTVVFEQEEEVSIAAELRRLNDINALSIEPKKTALSRKEEREQAVPSRCSGKMDASPFKCSGRESLCTFRPAKRQPVDDSSCFTRNCQQRHRRFERSTQRRSPMTWRKVTSRS